MDDKNEDGTPAQLAQASLANDRRRPGRVEYHSKDLIALFRGARTTPPELLDEANDPGTERKGPADDHDDLAAAKGIATAVVFGVALWMLSGLVVWFLI